MRAILLVLCLIICQSATCYQDEEYIKCSKKFREVIDDARTMEEEMQRWQQCKQYCGSDGSFESYYATIYLRHKKYSECLEYLINESSKHKDNQVPKRIMSALGEMHLGFGNIEKAREIGNHLAKRHYRWYGGYELLGLCHMDEKNFKKARYYLGIAVNKDDGMCASNLFNLIKADFFLHDYDEVVYLYNFAKDSGFNLDNISSHAAPIFTAISMIKTNRHVESRKLLVTQATQDPNIINLDGYKEAIRTYEKVTGKPFNDQ